MNIITQRSGHCLLTITAAIVQYYHPVRQYLIVEIDKEIYGFSKMQHSLLSTYTILIAAKTSSKTRFVQYVITAKNLFK